MIVLPDAGCAIVLILRSSGQNTGTRQTDGRTDGQTARAVTVCSRHKADDVSLDKEVLVKF